MRSLLNFIITLVLAGLLLNGIFAGMRASMVRANAEVYIAPEACPTKAVGGVCTVTGDESEDFLSGDRTITLRDGSVIYVPRQYVRGASWKSENVYYKLEPLVVLAAAGLALLSGLGIWHLNRRRPRA
jgi:hypothetical protein